MILVVNAVYGHVYKFKCSDFICDSYRYMDFVFKICSSNFEGDRRNIKKVSSDHSSFIRYRNITELVNTYRPHHEKTCLCSF